MTPKAAAARLNISRQRVMQLINSGRLAAMLVDGKWDVDEKAIAEFVRHPAGRPKG